MIKKLFYIAALLLPSLAYGGSPNADLSVQVMPSGGGIACDVGPNYAGSVPAPAQAAGFTHCALNADFTTNTTDSHGVNFSNINTWLYECGGSGAVTWNNTTFHSYYNDGGNGHVPAVGPLSCGTGTTLGTDGGSQVAQLQWPASANLWAYVLDWPNCEWCNPAGGPNGTGLPQAFYVETLFRTAPASWAITGDSGAPMDWWQDNNCSSGGCPGGYVGQEIDFGETHSSWYNGTTAQFYQSAGGQQVNFTFNPNVYNTWGTLITQDGAGNTSVCTYINGVRVTDVHSANNGCTQQSGYDTTVSTRNRNIAMWYGFNTCFGSCTPPSLATLYIKDIRIFACSGYWSSSCFGNLVTSAAETETRFAWLKGLYDKVADLVAPQAHADPFSPPLLGEWMCTNGKFDSHDTCMPPEFKGQNWWAACLSGRTDCVHSDAAYLGRLDEKMSPVRGPGYCYTGQPFTCSPDGKVP